jgi:hypothetical protein
MAGILFSVFEGDEITVCQLENVASGSGTSHSSQLIYIRHYRRG